MVPRILLFIDHFERGGTQTQLVHLANGLERDREFHVHIGCLRRGPLTSRLEVPNERLAEFPLRRFYDTRGMWQMNRLARYIAKARIDLVHALDFYANVMCTGAIWWKRRPRLVVSRRYKLLTQRRLHLWGERWCYRLADAVVMNSASVAREMVQRGLVSSRKVTVIPNGIDLSHFNQPVPPRPPKKTGKRIGVVARLCPDKGLDVIVRAFAELAPQWPDLELVIVGDGESRAELHAMIDRLGLSGRIVLAGAQSDVRPWIATFDIAVLPSRREGLPNVALEYLAMGRATVATGVGGVPDVVRDGVSGILVPPEDARSLAAALASLLRDPARRAALGREGVVRASEFAVGKMVEATRVLYRRLLSANSRLLPISSATAEVGEAATTSS